MANNFTPNLRGGANRLDSTWARLEQSWIPADPNMLGLIQDKLLAGEYKNSQQLRIDLQADLGILVYLNRRISDHTEASNLHPIRCIDQQSLAKLHSLIPESSERISKLAVADLSQIQKDQLQDYLVGCLAAEAIGGLAGTNIERGQDSAACFLLQQLGITLFSLAFPDLFAEFKSQGQHTDHLDQSFKARLEISPLAAGLQIAVQHRYDLKLLRAARTATAQASTMRFDSEDLSLALPRICIAAEAFARARRNPDNEQLQKTWKEQVHDLKQYFSASTLSQAARLIENYIDERLIIQTQAAERAPPPEVQEHALFEFMTTKNPLLDSCAPESVELLRPIYQLLNQEGADLMQALMALVEIVPKLGFARGCIYSAPPDNWKVESIVSIGDWRGERFEALEKWRKDLVVAALKDQAAQRRDGVLSSGERVSYVSGKVGPSSSKTALILEIDSENGPLEDPFSLFRALQRTFDYCLGGTASKIF